MLMIIVMFLQNVAYNDNKNGEIDMTMIINCWYDINANDNYI